VEENLSGRSRRQRRRWAKPVSVSGKTYQQACISTGTCLCGIGRVEALAYSIIHATVKLGIALVELPTRRGTSRIIFSLIEAFTDTAQIGIIADRCRSLFFGRP
jgi:hypothetical protein